MASKIQQLTALLKGSHYISETGLTAYYGAREAINGNRCATTERRYSAVKTALKNFRVMVTMSDNTIRVYRADTQKEFLFTL